jgi:uncharacterized membrane protein
LYFFQQAKDSHQSEQGASVFDFSFIPGLSGIGGVMPSIHGAADAAGGGLVGFLDTVLEQLSKISDAGGGFQWFPGIQTLGFNVHPALVHFPIAFLSVFFLLEIIGMVLPRDRLRQTAGAMLYCGTLGACLAAAAGLYAASTVPHGQDVHALMEWHERLGLTVAGLGLCLSVWRLWSKKVPVGMEKALFLLLSSLMTVSMVFGADLGGLMVYGHGVAVHSLQQEEAHHHHMHGSDEDTQQ